MKNLLICLSLFMCLSAVAQDTIYTKNAEKIIAKITRVSETKVEYKKLNNLDGPIFELSGSSIYKVVFQNGETQFFHETSAATITTLKSVTRNRINVDLLAIGVNGPTYLSYERITPNGGLGYEIPLNFHFNASGLIGYSTGVNFKYYVTKSAHGFYVGPCLGLGYFGWRDSYSYYGNTTYTGQVTGLIGFKAGGQFQVTRLFGINLGANADLLTNYQQIAYGYSVNLGINFSF